MKRSPRGAIGLLGIVIGLSLSGFSAGYGERVFNANPITGGNFRTVDDVERHAQSFQVAESLILYNVTLDVRNEADAPLNATIRPDAGGDPGSSILASSSRLGGARAWLDFPMTSRPILTGGMTYWIVAEIQPPGRSYRWYRSSADVVTGVSKREVGGSWSAPLMGDLGFVTFGMVLEPTITLGLGVDRATATPGTSYAYTVYLNNTGFRATPNAWVNLTLPPGVQWISDTSASLGGVSLGPTSWRIPQLGNGPHSFAVVAQVPWGAQGGTVLAASVQLEYTDTSGAWQPPGLASATVTVALRSKSMHLVHDGVTGPEDRMEAAPSPNLPAGPVPDFDADGSPGTTAGGAVRNWTLATGFYRPFRIRGAITVELFLNAPNATGSSATFNVSLHDRRDLAESYVASVRTLVAVDGNNLTYQRVAFDLGTADHLFATGNRTELRVTKTFGDDLWIGYHRLDLPSQVIVTTTTFVSIDRVDEFDLQGPATVFSGRDTVRIEANVSDPFGNSEIAGVRANLTDPFGNLVVADVPLAPIASDPAGYWMRFRFAYANPANAGTYAFLLTATEGNGVEASAGGTFLVRFPILSFSVSHDAVAHQVGDLVTLNISYSNEGTEDAPLAWINATAPSELVYVSDTTGGARTGPWNWTFFMTPPGSSNFRVTARVAREPANETVLVAVTLGYSDGKGFLWSASPRSVLLAVAPAPAPDSGLDPLLLALAAVGGLAAAAGGYWWWRSRKPWIEEAFLIHASGLLLYHASRSLRVEGEKDRDVLGGMIAAIKDFVQESFRYGENRELDKLVFGDYEVVIERGRYVFLAVACAAQRGSVDVRRRLRPALEEIETRFGKELETWDGYMDRILGVRDIVRRVVSRR